MPPKLPYPPGTLIRAKLDELQWTQHDLAKVLGVSEATVSDILAGAKQMKPELADQLSAVFPDTTAKQWMALEAEYRLSKLPKNHLSKKSAIERRREIYSKIPVNEIFKRGWIDKTKDLDELEKSVCNFLSIKNINDQISLGANFRQSNNQKKPNEFHQISWVKRVEYLASKQKRIVQGFDEKNLKRDIELILSHNRIPADIENLPLLLLALGIHFLFIPHLSKTYLDGCYINSKPNPIIALTLRYDRIDAFWFSLMHELGHAVLGHEASSLDDLQSGGHKDLAEIELQANKFAQDALIPPEHYQEFIGRNAPHFSRKAIIEFAADIDRHPGVVLGRLQWERHVPYSGLRSLLPKVSTFLEPWRDSPGPASLIGEEVL